MREEFQKCRKERRNQLNWQQVSDENESVCGAGSLDAVPAALLPLQARHSFGEPLSVTAEMFHHKSKALAARSCRPQGRGLPQVRLSKARPILPGLAGQTFPKRCDSFGRKMTWPGLETKLFRIPRGEAKGISQGITWSPAAVTHPHPILCSPLHPIPGAQRAARSPSRAGQCPGARLTCARCAEALAGWRSPSTVRLLRARLLL